MKTINNIPKNPRAKLILYTVSVVVMALSLLSCESFIEVDMPQSELTGNAVYEDVTTANAALADIYARMREGGVASGTSFGGTFLMANYADDMDFYGTNTLNEQFNKHTLLPTNANLLRLWNTTYGEIYAINALLEGVQSSAAITGEDRDRLLGEAYFLRAFNYFYLVNLFGDIPYVITTDYELNATIGKTSAAEVWNNIIQDLLLAESFLPESYPSSARVRANRATVHAMLARVHLYTLNYSQAEAYATLVIESGIYSIDTDPAAAFLKDSPSIIWSFHPGIAGQNTKDATTYNFTSGPPTKPTLSVNLYDSFENGDLRKTNWIAVISNPNGTWYRPFKYKLNAPTSESQEYTLLLRLEEQYLIRAEARAFNGNIPGAQADIDVIRTRAGLSATSAATQEELAAAILQERRHELFTEQCHRWFDLKRTGNAESVLSLIKPNWQMRDILLPLPEAELSLNENLLPQNPGY